MVRTASLIGGHVFQDDMSHGEHVLWEVILSMKTCPMGGHIFRLAYLT